MFKTTNSINQQFKKELRFGKIDALLNNAGFAVMGIFETATEEQIKNQYNVTFSE